FTEIKKQRAAVTAGQAKLDSGAAKLADAQIKLDTNAPKLKYAKNLLATSANFATVSKDGSVSLANIRFTQPISDVDKNTLKQIVALVDSKNIAGVQVEYSKEFVNDISGLLGAGEAIGLVIAAIVLLLLLGSLVAAGLPVLSALLGVGISATITLALGSLVEMNSTTPLLGVMLGLAVGIDYSLFILNRHIRQLKSGVELYESIGLATGTSGNAVVFAGLTVVIALAALNLTGIAFLGLMGTMGALGIVIAVLIAITFTPAMLRLVGMRVLSRKARRALNESPTAKLPDASGAEQSAPPASKQLFINRHPWISVLAAIIVLGVVAIPSSAMRLGLPDGSSEPTDSTQYRAFKLTTDAFGAGFNGGIVTVANIPAALGDTEKLKLQAEMATDLFALKNVAAVLPAGVSDNGKTYVFQIVPNFGPASVETEELVYAVRDLSGSFASKYDSTLGVTGMTAVNIDVSKKLADALPLYLGTILILSMFLLLLVFRSIAVPILASAGFLLTIYAVMGAITAVFQWGWAGWLFGVHDPGPILSFLPTIMIGILFGLAMDYQLFLTSGIREAFVHGKSPKDAVNYGIRLSRSVVVAAAIIMISVFGGFAFSHMAMIRPMGFGLAAGVLLDAFLVRLMLVPAVISLLGRAAWYLPKWLDRLLPNVDVEGEALEREHLH
ncbi:MAG: MMPL family transporter, partial [Actinomycetes bacterium]